MKTITITEKINGSGEPIKYGQSIVIDAEQAKKSVGTKSIYTRIGFINKTPFISQRGNGNGGSGDIVSLNLEKDATLEVNQSLFSRLNIWAKKNKLILVNVFSCAV